MLITRARVCPLDIDFARKESDLAWKTFRGSKIPSHGNANPEAICFNHLELM